MQNNLSFYSIDQVRAEIAEIDAILAADKGDSLPAAVAYVKRERARLARYVAAETYRNILWAIIASPSAPPWEAINAHMGAYVDLYNAGGRKLQTKVHNQVVRQWRKRSTAEAYHG
jgi:hypothetical protein